MRRTLLAATACILFSSWAQAAPGPRDVSVARMDEIARYYLGTREFMGAVLVARGADVIFSRAYGFANLEWNIPNGIETKFRLGSITKQFTAAAILQLEERGKLSLEDPVRKHYSDAPATWDEITLRHLLTHTSGIPDSAASTDSAATDSLPITPENSIRRFRERPLAFAPGAQMRYSNSGYILLGAIIEKASGMSYAEYVQRNIFEPLGMKDSGYDSNTAIIPRRAAGYALGPNGPVNASYVNMTGPYAAGALYSTVQDLHRWEQGLFGGKVMSAESLAKMTTPGKNDYALGVSVREISGARVIQHSGSINGFNSSLAYFPDSKVTIVTLSNLNGFGADHILEHFAALMQGKATVLPSERKAIEVPREILEKYVGTYRFAPGFDLGFTLEGGRLQLQGTGQPAVPLFAETATSFYPTAFEAQLEFHEDPDGKVRNVVVLQGGRRTIAPRIEQAR